MKYRITSKASLTGGTRHCAPKASVEIVAETDDLEEAKLLKEKSREETEALYRSLIPFATEETMRLNRSR